MLTKPTIAEFHQYVMNIDEDSVGIEKTWSGSSRWEQIGICELKWPGAQPGVQRILLNGSRCGLVRSTKQFPANLWSPKIQSTKYKSGEDAVNIYVNISRSEILYLECRSIRHSFLIKYPNFILCRNLIFAEKIASQKVAFAATHL